VKGNNNKNNNNIDTPTSTNTPQYTFGDIPKEETEESSVPLSFKAKEKGEKKEKEQSISKKEEEEMMIAAKKMETSLTS